MPESEPRGLGGWLILVAIGLVLSSVRIAQLLLTNHIPMFVEGHWNVLTSRGSPAYHPLWAPLIIFEVVGNLALFGVALFALVLFFRRAASFPGLMVGYLIGGFGFVALDSVAANLIPAVSAQADTGSSRALAQSLVACLVWVPYMYKSRRVRNTFVEGRSSRTPPQQAGGFTHA